MAALLGFVGQANAATMSLRALTPLLPPASALPPEYIVPGDLLDYSCVSEEWLEETFQADAPGERHLRMCLPEPCQAALDREQLAATLGFHPNDELWEDYITRYAQYCRHEAIWPGAESASSETRISDTAAFWTPLVAGRARLAALHRNGHSLLSGRPGILSGGGFGGLGGSTGGLGAFPSFPELDGSQPGGDEPDGVRPGLNDPIDPILVLLPGKDKPAPETPPADTGDSPQLTPIPLPASLALLLAALGTLVPIGRGRRA